MIYNLFAKKTILMLVFLMISMLFLTSCEEAGEEGGGLTKCEQLDGKAINLNALTDLNALKGKILDYVECGDVEVDVVVNFSMPMTQGDLDDPKNWRKSPNITLIFGDKGAICPADANVTLTFAKFEELGFPKIVANPTDGHKFKIPMGERQDFLDKLGNLDALLIIGDDPSQDGDNIVIRDASEITEKVNLAVARVAEKGKAEVVLMYDIGVSSADIAQLNKLLDSKITIAGTGKIFAATNGIVVTPELLNKIPYTNKEGLNKLFQLSPESNKYELKDHNYHVLVKDTLAYGETGEWLKLLIPLNGIYYDVNLADVDNFEHLKDFNGKIDVVMMSKERAFHSVWDPMTFAENSFGAPGEWFLDNIETKATGARPNAKFKIVNEKGEGINPLLGIFDYPPELSVRAPSGTKDKGIKVKELTANNIQILAASYYRARDERVEVFGDDLLASLGGSYKRFATYPIFQHGPDLHFNFTPVTGSMNSMPIIDMAGRTVIGTGQVLMVCSEMMTKISEAVGNGNQRLNRLMKFPLSFHGLSFNHVNIDAGKYGIIVSAADAARLNIKDVGQIDMTNSDQVAELKANNHWVDHYFGHGAGFIIENDRHGKGIGQNAGDLMLKERSVVWGFPQEFHGVTPWGAGGKANLLKSNAPRKQR